MLKHQAITTKLSAKTLSVSNAGPQADYIYFRYKKIYRKTSNIRRTLVGDKIVDHSDAVGASPVGTAPTTSSFST